MKMFWNKNDTPVLRIIKFYPDVQTPTKAHEDDAGYDVFSRETIFIQPGEFIETQLGIGLDIPRYFTGFLVGRSSLNRKGLSLIGPGIIDSGYMGEISAFFLNTSKETIEIKQGDRIAQVVVLPIPAFPLSEEVQFRITERGPKGLGSTGR
jgi:dUTP pyrophosphatase